VSLLSTALEKAVASLKRSGAPFAADTYALAARELLAKHIVEAARAGEHDPRKLADDAVSGLAQTSLRSLRRPAGKLI
jgi:hypothetical protein